MEENYTLAPVRIGAVLSGLWWYWVNIIIGQYWLIHEGTGSVKGKYWLVCGDNGSVWGGTGWYLVRRGQLIYDGTGSIWSRTG